MTSVVVLVMFVLVGTCFELLHTKLFNCYFYSKYSLQWVGLQIQWSMWLPCSRSPRSGKGVLVQGHLQSPALINAPSIHPFPKIQKRSFCAGPLPNVGTFCAAFRIGSVGLPNARTFYSGARAALTILKSSAKWTPIIYLVSVSNIQTCLVLLVSLYFTYQWVLLVNFPYKFVLDAWHVHCIYRCTKSWR